MRDIMKDPYSPEEQRVSDYIQDITSGMIGSGDDPIGFILASHELLSYELRKTFSAKLVTELSSLRRSVLPEPQKP